MTRKLGWFDILRLGLVQAAIGSLVVITTSTLNRVLVVELALPAILPGVLVALHYFVQVVRPRFGYDSDLGGRRTPWIIGGIATLAAGGVGAVLATCLMPINLALGIALAVLAFIVIGLGVGASGTALLVLMSKRIAPQRLAAAATVTWLMMIVGFIVTSVIAGRMLEPFSLTRLVETTVGIGLVALLVTVLAVYGIERDIAEVPTAPAQAERKDFVAVLREVWAEPHSRRLTSFIFVSMLAYSAQDLILEPFAGAVFGLTPGETTKLSGTQNAGVLLGMLFVAVICTTRASSRIGSIRSWTLFGCVSSAAMLVGLAVAGLVGANAALKPLVFGLGLANGAYAVAAIGSMMGLVGRGRGEREGTRMGLWGAAQAVAFGLGGILATGSVDLVRAMTGSVAEAYGLVFAAEALLFVLATVFAVRLSRLEVRNDDDQNVDGLPSYATGVHGG
jgi:BCD family chlorophyll transporter-like MFS transporter